MTDDIDEIIPQLRSEYFDLAWRYKAADALERLKAERNAERRHSQNCNLAMVRANDQALEAMARAEAAEAKAERLEALDFVWKQRAEAAEKRLVEINRIVHVPTKDTKYRKAEDHFQADFDAIRKLCDDR